MAIWDEKKDELVFDDEGKVITESAAHVMCPTCAGHLIFDANLEKLTCKNCGGIYNPSSLEFAGKMETRDTEAASEEDDANVEFVCDNCGATVVTDGITAATFCAFCGSPALLRRRLTQEFRPDYIIPFTVSKEQAKQNFWDWVKKNRYAPRNFINEESLEKITGIYVPFWLVDADCHTDIGGTGTIIEGNMKSIFSIDRLIDFSVRMVPFDGSKKIRNLLMEAIEPYDYSEIKEYNPFYLPGYYAQRYDESALEMTDRIKSRMDAYARQLGRFVTMNEYTSTSFDTPMSYSTNFKQSYALFPGWFLKYKYNGLTYDFAVNGQTGEAAGDIPVSEVKRKARIGLEILKWSLIPLSVLAIVGFIIFGLLSMRHLNARLVGNTIYYLVYGVIALFPSLGYAVYKVKKVAFDTANPIDSAPTLEQYIDTKSHFNMVKNDKFAYFSQITEEDSRSAIKTIMRGRKIWRGF